MYTVIMLVCSMTGGCEINIPVKPPSFFSTAKDCAAAAKLVDTAVKEEYSELIVVTTCVNWRRPLL